MKAQTITIIGLDRVGVSIGLALKKSSLDVTVIGHDANREWGHQAKMLNAIDKTNWNLFSAATEADILILTVPAVGLEETLQVVGSDLKAHTLVLDFSSLKALGQKWAKLHMSQGHYVGAVPVLSAGVLTDGRLGPEAATADLFRNSVFCLMPSPTADPQAVETAVNMGLVLGATPYFLDAAEYDGLMQGVSTIPGLMAAAVFNAVHKATGWRDILRFAGLPFALTTSPLNEAPDIALQVRNNKEATLRWLDALLEEMEEIRRWVYHDDSEQLDVMLQELAIHRQKWIDKREKNDWVEGKRPDVPHTSIAEQMLGGFARRRGRDE